MAQQQQNRAAKDRRSDIEKLAADLFLRRVCAVTGKTPESLARDALEAARTFYRVVDES